MTHEALRSSNVRPSDHAARSQRVRPNLLTTVRSQGHLFGRLVAGVSVILCQCSSVRPSSDATGASGASGASGNTTGGSGGNAGSVIDIVGGAGGSAAGCSDNDAGLAGNAAHGGAAGAGGASATSGASGASGAGASGGSATVSCTTVTGQAHYTQDVLPILQSCTGEICHAAPTRASMVGVAASGCCDGRFVVSPSSLEHSYLINKVLGHDLCSGTIMPPDRLPLSSADVLTLQRWICNGALDD